MLYLLLIYTLILLILSYKISKGNVFAPTVVAFFSFSLAFIFAIINISYWKIDLHITTIIVFLVGLSSFFLGGLVKPMRSYRPLENHKIIRIPNYKIIILTCISLVIFYSYKEEILRIAIHSGASANDSNSDIMSSYRSSMMFSGDPKSKINTWVNQGGNVLMVLSYIFLFVYCNNKILGEKFKNNWKNLVVVFIFVVQSLSTGGRANVMALIAAYLFFNFILARKYHKTSRQSKTQMKQYLRTLLVVIVSLWSFYSIREFIGRSNSKDYGFLEYMSIYIGGSIPLLDSYIVKPVRTAPNSFGEETFMGINDFVHKFNPAITYTANLEFRYTNTGIFLGNVYTPFRRYFHDFGWIGLLLIPFFISWIYTFLLYKIKRKRVFGKTVIYILIYGSILQPLIFYGMEEYFFMQVVSVGFITRCLIFLLGYRYLIKPHLTNPTPIEKGI